VRPWIAAPTDPASAPFYLLIPYAWAFSLLHTLNSRRAISLGALESEGGSPPISCVFTATTAHPTPFADDKSRFDLDEPRPELQERRRSSASGAMRMFHRQLSVDDAPPVPQSPRSARWSRHPVAGQIAVSVETTSRTDGDDLVKPASPTLGRLHVVPDESHLAPVAFQISLERRASDAAAAAAV